jgi:hypothetical protein
MGDWVTALNTVQHIIAVYNNPNVRIIVNPTSVIDNSINIKPKYLVYPNPM